MSLKWKTSRRLLTIERPLVMGILNVTPDSFSDGGRHVSVESALAAAAKMIEQGADIIDVGGESTRPGSMRVPADEEIRRTAPVIEAIAARFDVPLSIDTTKLAVAQAALDTGAEIINDISGLRWDEGLGDLAASSGAGLVIMHSRGEFESMHSQPPVDDIVANVISGLKKSVETARAHAVSNEQIVLDIGIGFGKTPEQNLELLAKLDRIVGEFDGYPVLVGASRKSFIGKLLGGMETGQRLAGSLAAGMVAVQKGAAILRVHDVAETVQALKLIGAIQNA